MREPLLRIKRLRAFGRSDTLIRAVAQEPPRVRRIPQIYRQRHVAQLRPQPGVIHRRQHLHPVIEIALHQVRAADQQLVVAGPAVGKVVDAAVLQEAPDQAHHADILAHARHTRP